MDEIMILIPSLNPDEKLIEVIKSLKNIGFTKILIVDDGSEEKTFFIKAQDEFSCKILTLDKNMGKGRALKTGFEHILAMNDTSLKAVVTVDGDNQHKAKDVLAVSKNIDENTLVLGVRKFKDATNVPFRSRFGNAMTAYVFRLLSGEKIEDTQTGLRAIPILYLDKFINVEGERFEYEMNILLRLRRLNLKLKQIEIETIYLEENESSHFRPIADSFRIFNMIGKFALVGIICFFVDYLIFYISLYGLMNIGEYYEQVFIASVIARICSSILNFSLNYAIVFKSSTNKLTSFIKYYFLVIIQMMISSVSVAGISILWKYPLVVKLIVDFLLFFISYYIQKLYIFSKKEKN